MPPNAALAFDIDGTLTTANPSSLKRLINHAKASGVDMHINTARPSLYCADPSQDTISIVPRSKHHCLVHPDPPTSKVLNMQRMQSISGVNSGRCNILIDDRPENIAAIEAAGFSGVLVDERTGIDDKAADVTIRLINECLAETNSPNKSKKSRRTLRFFLVLAIVILAVITLLL